MGPLYRSQQLQTLFYWTLLDGQFISQGSALRAELASPPPT